MILYVLTKNFADHSSISWYPANIELNDWYYNIYDYQMENDKKTSFFNLDDLTTYLTDNSLLDATMSANVESWKSADFVNAVVFDTLEEATAWIGAYKLSDATLLEDLHDWQTANGIVNGHYWFDLPTVGAITREGIY